MNNNTSNANRNHRNGLSPDQRKNRVRTVSLIVLAILALAAIVTGVFLFNKNRKAKNTLETPVSLNTQEVAVVTDPVETEVIATEVVETEVVETTVVETTVPTPVPTVEVQLPSPSILATKVGYYDPSIGYIHYDRSGSDYPHISPSGSDENPELITIDEPTEINDGLAVYTYGEVGVMFAVFPLDFDDLEENDNQLYAYGDTEVDISTDDQGKKNIMLSEGAIFLKMITRDDVAEVEFPNHGDSIARIIGGSVLLTLEDKTISFWCVSEECQLEFSDKTLNFREKHMQLYYWQTNYVSEAENYWLTPQRLKEYMLWNHKCDLCMPVPPLPTGTPVPYHPPTKYSLTVNTVGQGSVTPNGGTYEAGTPVTLTATPAPGWQFDGWSGDASGSDNPLTITMDGNKTITATFSKIQGTMYTLTVNTVGQGSVTPNGGTYEAGTPVTLTASPASGWQFDGWSGDASGSNNPLTITMDGNKTITATFSKIQGTMYTLTVNTVGQGSVTPNGGTYEAGTPVTLTASPASGWQFDGWSGDASGSDNPITITMDGDKTITATFDEIPIMYTLTTDTDGFGSIELDPPGGVYPEGTHVTLTAIPADGWQFDGWVGDASGSDNPITIIMDRNKTVIALFTWIPQNYTLTVSVEGTGIGEVTLDPPGGVYPEGTPVTLTAIPEPGHSVFVEWQGDASGTENPITITMDSDKSVIAIIMELVKKDSLREITEGPGYVFIEQDKTIYLQ